MVRFHIHISWDFTYLRVFDQNLTIISLGILNIIEYVNIINIWWLIDFLTWVIYWYTILSCTVNIIVYIYIYIWLYICIYIWTCWELSHELGVFHSSGSIMCAPNHHLSSMCFKALTHSSIVTVSNIVLVGLISNIYSGTIWFH